MRLNWQDLGPGDGPFAAAEAAFARWGNGGAPAEDADGAMVEIDGFPASVLAAERQAHFILTSEPACCPGCLPRDRTASVEVFAASPIPLRGRLLRLTGIWRVRHDDTTGWRYQLHGARLREPPGWTAVTRRGVLAGGPPDVPGGVPVPSRRERRRNTRPTRRARSRPRRPWISTAMPAASPIRGACATEGVWRGRATDATRRDGGDLPRGGVRRANASHHGRRAHPSVSRAVSRRTLRNTPCWRLPGCTICSGTRGWP